MTLDSPRSRSHWHRLRLARGPGRRATAAAQAVQRRPRAALSERSRRRARTVRARDSEPECALRLAEAPERSLTMNSLFFVHRD
jgi:hypothetical protein